jgi:2-keto-4-pentenoate hydratase/2-oxohepta-3-ene-1,7-dioic acid hydratase in catechol pathway
MKICRFSLRGDPDSTARLGVVLDDGVHDVTQIAQSLPALHWPLPPGDQLIANLASLRPAMLEMGRTDAPIAPERIKLLAPVANPGKFICGAGNWKHHGAPFGFMGFMFKASSALAGPDEGVQLSWAHRPALHEPELAIIIGRTCRNVSALEALAYVAGYACALDMTMQREHEDYAFCKSFDSFGMLGPWLVTADEIGDPSQLSYRFWVNDELRGERSFADLTGGPAQMIALASTAMTLYPGDIILSGAADVAPVGPDDVMKLEIPGLGQLTTKVSLSPYALTQPLSA